MGTLLVAHGTRNNHGVAMIADLAAAMADRLDEQVRVAFVDVLGPTPSEVLTSLEERPTVVVPAFLSSGFHVCHDLPREIAESAHPAVTVTDALGPSPELARAMLGRLLDAGWRRGDAVVMAAAGTRDPQAQGQIRATAAMLSALVGGRVRIAFAAPPKDGSGYPSVPEVVAAARADGARTVAVASYLLAEGLFQQRLRESDGDIVADPLGLHPAVVRLACLRRRHAGFAVTGRVAPAR
ncbi:Cobalamin (Vitamin B12) biosynthesis CbiX protein OS=Tsukamurella paurometabola (strain ATCC 8368/ DSM / CCUG 35730 / CIP 100753 / JCM 10117 / KCTC 9821/ NBRC 16120 / NCIMB 702349 / NCTC 13040) OX=521096 GN=Tpau_1378 PE=4 SV=1 [Tsukamurella paurometabola]|uniref:Cobalamin (Vitamin B12) biosynthesis CbiX protein n=1 Tax=Tsukamurella paurometabola (strain ATCC 8368 / DSM 20162 / CCUG 35730 / CIP 100753 / JCM 10117 / KCTC 9821 / NBRC 16120 / NCIMB 702349 / NCTC 13040) TaxID=521096 RepID=D5UWY4_TSUPD|nr:sirohydrochlorin chelatase [Tsukamurella paurometabola]ADG78006.1 cobalamin (vitamin B12) biosynthesis CbiX protein [Tsukamurella paurometabola DSM 20162]SUP29751.1 sirohydrochlorin cobaltochelatase [Tsukamurella paurometabola]